MKRQLSIIGLTLVFLIAFDAGVAGLLTLAERQNRLGGLVRYFDYGLSVPGKLEQWNDRPGIPGNLFDVAWRGDVVAASQALMAEAPGSRPVVRAYGMSFVNNILREAENAEPSLATDLHGGPAAPPNYTFALYEDDRTNRRAGDIVVLGFLSSSLHGMASLSNRTWSFEQPAPFTYPVYLPDGSGLRRIEPVVQSAAQERAILQGTSPDGPWMEQLSTVDGNFTRVAFALPWLDRSPFARLVRRALATGSGRDRKAHVTHGDGFPIETVVQRMILSFAGTARQDGQVPLVMLIQSRDPTDPDLLAMARPALEASGVAYLATAEHFDPRDPAGFRPDGHYVRDVDALFARALLETEPFRELTAGPREEGALSRP